MLLLVDEVSAEGAVAFLAAAPPVFRLTTHSWARGPPITLYFFPVSRSRIIAAIRALKSAVVTESPSIATVILSSCSFIVGRYRQLLSKNVQSGSEAVQLLFALAAAFAALASHGLLFSVAIIDTPVGAGASQCQRRLGTNRQSTYD